MSLRRAPPQAGAAAPADRLSVVLETGLAHHAAAAQMAGGEADTEMNYPGGYLNPANWFFGTSTKSAKDWRRLDYKKMPPEKRAMVVNKRSMLLNELKDLKAKRGEAAKDDKVEMKEEELAQFEYRYMFSQDMPRCWGKKVCDYGM